MIIFVCFREVFNITNFIIVELAPKLYNLLGLSIINKKFNNVCVSKINTL